MEQSQNTLIFQSCKIEALDVTGWHHPGYGNSLFKSTPGQQQGNISVWKLTIIGFLTIKQNLRALTENPFPNLYRERKL